MRDVQYEDAVWIVILHRVGKTGKNHDVSLKHWDVTAKCMCVSSAVAPGNYCSSSVYSVWTEPSK